MARKNSTTITRRRMKAKFLQALGELQTVGSAAKLIGVNRSTPYDWASEDAEFKADWDDITEGITDRLEVSLIESALNGYTETKTITEGSQVRVEEHHKRDPNSARFLLGARRRRLYGAKQEVELSGEVTTKRIVWGDLPPETTKQPQGELEDEDE